MINKLIKGLVDLIFGTKRIKSKYQNANPTETVLAADGSKGIRTSDKQNIQRGLDWVTSQRAVVLLTNTKIICGKWVIPLDSIKTVQLIKIQSFFIAGQVLIIQTNNDENFQFGMQLNPEWTEQQVLPLTLEKGKMKYSPFSIIVRLVLLGYLIYWIYERFILS